MIFFSGGSAMVRYMPGGRVIPGGRSIPSPFRSQPAIPVRTVIPPVAPRSVPSVAAPPQVPAQPSAPYVDLAAVAERVAAARTSARVASASAQRAETAANQANDGTAQRYASATRAAADEAMKAYMQARVSSGTKDFALVSKSAAEAATFADAAAQQRDLAITAANLYMAKTGRM